MNCNMKTNEEIKSYEEVDSSFTDYTRFEDVAKRRAVEKYAFMHNRIYTPNFKYPKLDFLIDDETIPEKKTKILEAIMELEAAKANPDVNAAELELYADFHETRLKRILLVEAARNISNPIVSEDYEVNRDSFAELNAELYGEFNDSYYLGILDTEKKRLSGFKPKSEIESNLKYELGLFFDGFDTCGQVEKELFDEASILRLHEYVMERYEAIFKVVPKTPDDVYFDVSECVAIMNDALKAGGLFDLGWRVVEDEKKIAVSTLTSKKKIRLPSDISRNSNELCRLIIHEQEVHARRGQNGQDTGIKILSKGTADYADIEEGLAIMLECAVAGKMDNSSFDRARDRYITAGLALGIDGYQRDARETYEILWRILAIRKAERQDIDEELIYETQEKAYELIENAYRGTQFWMKGVIYTKLKIYYEGFVKSADYFKDHMDNLDLTFEDLFLAKYNHISQTEKALVKKAIEHNSRSKN